VGNSKRSKKARNQDWNRARNYQAKPGFGKQWWLSVYISTVLTGNSELPTLPLGITIAVPCSLPTIMEDLPDTLLGDAQYLSQRRYRLACLVPSADFSIACAFGGRAIGNRGLREKHAAVRDCHRERHGKQHLGE
jgi:hypothetical protein